MTIQGDTKPARFMVFKSYDIERRMQNFDWEQARWLRFERHFNSPGRTIKNVAIGLLLMAVSVIVFRYHRSVPDDLSQDVFDWSAQPDGDVDLDVD